MRIATAADSDFLRSTVTDPRLRVWTAFDGYREQFNPAPYVVGPSFAVVGEEGCFLASHLGPGRYVVHTNLLPSCRGAAALRAAREAVKIAFIETDTVELVTMVPAHLPHALWFARSMGMRQVFARPAMWPSGGKLWDVTFLQMTIEDWAAAGPCRASGEWFHERLGGAKSHADDPVHDAFVGAAVDMMRAGRVAKAVEFYNRWAVFALYQPVKVLSEDPLRIDIRTHVLRVEGGDFNVEEASHA